VLFDIVSVGLAGGPVSLMTCALARPQGGDGPSYGIVVRRCARDETAGRLSIFKKIARVAQLGAHRIRKAVVGGSKPSTGSNSPFGAEIFGHSADDFARIAQSGRALAL
jgi:hypothetical protein